MTATTQTATTPITHNSTTFGGTPQPVLAGNVQQVIPKPRQSSCCSSCSQGGMCSTEKKAIALILLASAVLLFYSIRR